MATSVVHPTEPLSRPVFERPAVRGGARLRYQWCPLTEQTRLVQQWVRPPLYMNKAYHEKGWAVSQMMSPTGGLLQDDVLEIDVELGAGSRAALISPAACRVHSMQTSYARIQQTFRVGAEAIFDLWPAPLILQAGARLQQQTRVDLAPSARVLLCELVSPGRVACGEAFRFNEWRSKLEIRREEELLVYENFSARPSQGDLADWQSLFPGGLYASLYYLSPDPMEALLEALNELSDRACSVGASPLRKGGIGVKLIAEDSCALRRRIAQLRSLILPAPDALPHALKRAQTFFY